MKFGLYHAEVVAALEELAENVGYPEEVRRHAAEASADAERWGLWPGQWPWETYGHPATEAAVKPVYKRWRGCHLTIAGRDALARANFHAEMGFRVALPL